MYGVEPILPFDLTESTFLVKGFRKNLTTSELLALQLQQLEHHPKDIAKAADILIQARLQSKQQFEKCFETRLVKGSYSPEELVLICNSAIEKELSRKTKPQYLGLYQVVHQTQCSSYILTELDRAQLARPVAAFRVIPYIQCKTLQELAQFDNYNPAEENSSDTE